MIYIYFRNYMSIIFISFMPLRSCIDAKYVIRPHMSWGISLPYIHEHKTDLYNFSSKNGDTYGFFGKGLAFSCSVQQTTSTQNVQQFTQKQIYSNFFLKLFYSQKLTQTQRYLCMIWTKVCEGKTYTTITPKNYAMSYFPMIRSFFPGKLQLPRRRFAIIPLRLLVRIASETFCRFSVEQHNMVSCLPGVIHEKQRGVGIILFVYRLQTQNLYQRSMISPALTRARDSRRLLTSDYTLASEPLRRQ